VVPGLDAGSACPIESRADKKQVSRFGHKLMLKKFLIVAGALAVAAPFAVSAQGSADAARGKVSMCVGCHEIPGYKSSFPTVYSVPMIAGQSSKYIEAALTAYRKGERSHPTMRAIAGSLSDQDIADIAAYYGTK
jgi:cytochrome c553